ncbi:hypothetical protein CsSME_00032668 [Camellia sinensis var. sinensis]
MSPIASPIAHPEPSFADCGVMITMKFEKHMLTSWFIYLEEDVTKECNLSGLNLSNPRSIQNFFSTRAIYV